MILQSQRIWILEQWVPAQLELEGSRIKAIHAYGHLTVDKDYGNQRVLPGFIDTHCHGAYGFDTNDAHSDGLAQWAKAIAEEGVTSFCPTTITQSEEVLTKALKNVADFVQKPYSGSQIVGIHLEGPYLDKAYKGAQPEPFIVDPNIAQFERYQKAANHLIKVMTMAVEHDRDHEFIRAVSATGVAIHIGHSGATYQQALLGFANGAKGTTHTFNGMSPLNHREPGLAGAAMRLSSVYSELICDGVHVSYPVMNLLYKVKGKDKLILVTDALCAKGVGEGTYVFGGQTIDIRSDGGAYLANTSKLSGSTLRFNQGLRNVIENAEVDVVSAINSATINPAKLLGIDHHKGLIQAHYDADLVILADDYSVVETYVLGQSLYKAS